MASQQKPYFKTSPPPNLSKEKLGIWLGWSELGNKEVAREAAGKGTHLDLVYTFLSARNRISITDAQKYFKEQAFAWICELLENKKVFRASHVLKNIQLNPEEELLKIFKVTKSEDLRSYIGNHLDNAKILTENDKALWTLLKKIESNPDSTIKNCNISFLESKTNEWKSQIATELFLKTFDANITNFITSQSLWSLLLATNNTAYLKIWISCKYDDSFIVENADIPEILMQLFKTLSLSNDLLDLIENGKTISNTTKESILTELSKFGVFIESEKNDLTKILSRLKSTNSIGDIYNILERKTSTVNLRHFFNLLSSFCVNKNYLTVLSNCLQPFPIETIQNLDECDNKNLMCLQNCRQFTHRLSEVSLRDNIYNVVNFLLSVLPCDLATFFNDNPLILFSLIMFTKDSDFINVAINQEEFTINNVKLNNFVANILSKFPTIKSICDIYLGSSICTALTYYDLLETNLGIDVKKLFKNKYEKCEIFHFNNKELVQNFGYSKKVNYVFYVKQLRPSIAAKKYVIQQFQEHEYLDDGCFKRAEPKIFKLALKNFDNIELTSSCVAFLEMIGVNSEFLRINLKAANIFYQADIDENFIKTIFLNLSDRQYDALSILEGIILETMDFKLLSNASNLIDAIKSYEIVVKFSIVNNIKLPEQFLKLCASNNLWLPFLIFAQMYSYPTEQIKELLHCFKNPYLLEHINHGVCHDIQIDQDSIMKERDSRKYFLSRIGVKKSIDTLSPKDDSLYSSMASHSSSGSSTTSDFLEIDVLNTKATLLQTLIRCHNSTDPPRALLQACQLYRNPLLAIFATSYEPDSVHTNWLTWLAVSSELYHTFTNFESMALNSGGVSSLLESVMKNGYHTTLLQSFNIFLPDNPLKIFLEFLHQSINLNFNEALLISKLDKFKTKLKTLRRSSILTTTDHDLVYLNNKNWLENTALALFSKTVEYNFSSLYQQLQYMRVICGIKFGSYFTVELPHFESLLNILHILHDSNCNGKVTLDIGAVLSIYNSREAIVDCINKLLDQKMFKTALEVAKVENLPLDLILVKEWRHHFLNRPEKENNSFWTECNKVFTDHNVTADCVIDFYEECLKILDNPLQKYIVSKLTYEWANQFELSSQYHLEQTMWLHYVNLPEKYKLPNSLELEPDSFLYKDMQDMLENVPKYPGELTRELLVEFEKMIACTLNIGNTFVALKLEKMFGCKSNDLETLKLCYSLAEGLVMPYQLNTDQRLLISKSSTFRRYGSSRGRNFLSTRLTSFSSTSLHSQANVSTANLDTFDCPTQDTLVILHSLTEKLTHGVDIANKIFMTYRISINIEIPYNIVVTNHDFMKMMKTSIEEDCVNKLEVVHDFVHVYKLSKAQVTDFICEELIIAATNYVKAKPNNFFLWDLNIDQDFHLVLQLLQENCSLLGHKIYSYANTLHKAQVITNSDFKISDLALVIELLVRAHDCFTTDCNMEGISMILKKCQSVVCHLLNLRSWKLIVRLLTGVARYTEMNYVFQILRENDQFEFLLRKGSRKDNALKVALLDYLKKYCPDNKDLYKMVALHFTLFSEIAQLWEREALGIIRNLIAISKLEMQNNKLNPDTEPFVLFTHTDGTKLCLNKAMENYVHATEFHLQGEKMAKAMNSSKQAELVALQLSTLKYISQNQTTICLLNLTNSQISSLLSSVLSFDQSLLVIEAYNFQADWSTVLYEQIIFRNNSSYLDRFLKHLTLSDSIIHDISRKFLTANLNSPNEIASMKKILNKLPSVHTKYRIASELGFTDMIEDLISRGQLAFLKDTVWKKGYKNN